MLYELLTISCGVETVILSTTDKKTVRRIYQRAGGQGCLRLRVDGQMLTIREADKFCGQNWPICHDVRKSRRCGSVSAWGVPYKHGVHAASNRKAVEMVIDGQVVERYDSIADAAEDNHLSVGTVQCRCSGRRKNVDGVVYRYAQS